MPEVKKPIKNPDAVVRREEEEAVVFNPADGNLVCINGTGVFVWDLCDGSRGIDDLVKALVSEYEVSSQDAEKDCLEYVKNLKEAGLIGYEE